MRWVGRAAAPERPLVRKMHPSETAPIFGCSLSLVVLATVVLVFLTLASSTIKIAKEYERGVVFRLGRLPPLRGPGLFVIIPGIDRVTKVDLRVNTLVVPQQEVITSDNVTVKVNAVIFFQVMDAQAQRAGPLRASPDRPDAKRRRRRLGARGADAALGPVGTRH